MKKNNKIQDDAQSLQMAVRQSVIFYTTKKTKIIIKENELRSGNLILGFYEYEEDNRIDKCVCEFLGYTPFSNYFNVKGEIYIEEFTKFEPISLTEEWLLKFGFLIIEINGKFEATLPNFRYNIYWNKYTDGFLFCDGETVLINFNYVHELQNLVFVLGQRELTVA